MRLLIASSERGTTCAPCRFHAFDYSLPGTDYYLLNCELLHHVSERVSQHLVLSRRTLDAGIVVTSQRQWWRCWWTTPRRWRVIASGWSHDRASLITWAPAHNAHMTHVVADMIAIEIDGIDPMM